MEINSLSPYTLQPDILRVWGSRRLARLWTSRRLRGSSALGPGIVKDREAQQQGWSDFLGRDDSDTALSARLRDQEQAREGEGDVEEKPPDRDDKDQDGGSGSGLEMDLFAALNRGPSK